jgi:hypothetical protein
LVKFMENCINTLFIFRFNFPFNFRLCFQLNFFFLSISLRFSFADESLFMIWELSIKVDQLHFQFKFQFKFRCQFKGRLFLGLRYQISMHLFERSIVARRDQDVSKLNEVIS